MIETISIPLRLWLLTANIHSFRWLGHIGTDKQELLDLVIQIDTHGLIYPFFIASAIVLCFVMWFTGIEPYFEEEFLHQLIIVESGKNNTFDISMMKGFYSHEKELGQIDKIVLPDKLFAKILFSFDERKNLECYDYSTVGIFDGVDNNSNVQGTGFLVLYQEDIFCVTCQHLFKSYNLEKAYIKFKKSKIKYEVNFLNLHNEPTGQDSPAINNVLIMKMEKNALSKIDRDKLFSCSTLITEKEAIQTKFRMFGYSSTTGTILNSIRFVGECDNDYYLLRSEEGRAQKGFSGASVVSEKGDFLGMHASHKNNDIFVIPADQILKEIKKIKKQGVQNNGLYPYLYGK